MYCPKCNQLMTIELVTTDGFHQSEGHTQIEENVWYCKYCGHQEPIF